MYSIQINIHLYIPCIISIHTVYQNISSILLTHCPTQTPRVIINNWKPISQEATEPNAQKALKTVSPLLIMTHSVQY